MSSLVIAGLLIRVAREAHEADIVSMTEQPIRPRRYRPGGRRRRHEHHPLNPPKVAQKTPAIVRPPTRIRPEGVSAPKLSRRRKRPRSI